MDLSASVGSPGVQESILAGLVVFFIVSFIPGTIARVLSTVVHLRNGKHIPGEYFIQHRNINEHGVMALVTHFVRIDRRWIRPGYSIRLYQEKGDGKVRAFGYGKLDGSHLVMSLNSRKSNSTTQFRFDASSIGEDCNWPGLAISRSYSRFNQNLTTPTSNLCLMSSICRNEKGYVEYARKVFEFDLENHVITIH